MIEYLAIESGGYLYEHHSRINCSMAGSFAEKLMSCGLIEHVCQGRKVLSAIPRTGYCAI